VGCLFNHFCLQSFVNFIFDPFNFTLLYFDPKPDFVHIFISELERGERKSLKNNVGEIKLSIIYILTPRKSDFGVNESYWMRQTI